MVFVTLWKIMLDYSLLVHMPYALKTTIPPLQKVADCLKTKLLGQPMFPVSHRDLPIDCLKTFTGVTVREVNNNQGG